MEYVLWIGLPVVIAVVLTLIAGKIEKKNAIAQLTEVLHRLGKDEEAENIRYNVDARWNGQVSGKDVELEYFLRNKSSISENYLYIKTPFRTNTVFLIKNPSHLRFTRKSFLNSNEICLEYIESEALRNQLILLFDDVRFCNIRTRLNSFDSKFVVIPDYDVDKNVVNRTIETETDALSIMLARPHNLDHRNEENDFSSDFLLAAIQLLHEIKEALKKIFEPQGHPGTSFENSPKDHSDRSW